MNCHPERSEGPAVCGPEQVLRFAQDDNAIEFAPCQTGSARLSKTTTCAIAALSVPIPSGVLALIPTQSAGTPHSSATRLRIASAWGPIFGVDRISVESRFISS